MPNDALKKVQLMPRKCTGRVVKSSALAFIVVVPSLEQQDEDWHAVLQGESDLC